MPASQFYFWKKFQTDYLPSAFECDLPQAPLPNRWAAMGCRYGTTLQYVAYGHHFVNIHSADRPLGCPSRG